MSTSCMALVLQYSYVHDYVFLWSVASVCGDCLNLTHDVESFFHFTKNSVLPVEVWCAAHCSVGFLLSIAESLDSSLGCYGMSLSHEVVLQIHESFLVTVATKVHDALAVLLHEFIEYLLLCLHLHLLAELPIWLALYC